VRVAIDIQSLLRRRTGVGHALYDLIEAIAPIAAPDEITAFYFSRRRLGLPFCNDRFRERRVGFPPGRALSWLWRHVPFPAVDRFLDGADVCHFPDFVARPVRRGKVIVTIHDLSFARLPQTVEPKNRAYLARNVPTSLARADAVIAVSEFTRREIEELFPVARGKVHVVHHGVRPALEAPPGDAPDAELPPLPERFVLAVGTLEPRKNLGVLLDAIHLIRSDVPLRDVGLVVVGGRGWLSDELELRLAAEQMNRRVTRLGYVSDATLSALYRRAAVLAFPTLYEGFGLPVLEAMACGLPVVCTNVASLPEVAGDAALLVDELLPESLADALRRVLTDEALAADLSRRGRERAATFTWKKAARQTLDVYRTVAEGGDAHRH
jgi:glycosyltransferase involved in cell wall biosynthesis